MVKLVLKRSGAELIVGEPLTGSELMLKPWVAGLVLGLVEPSTGIIGGGGGS